MDANRTGGEDLVVLGCHIFDLARLFAGDAHWCTAWIRQSAHDATLADVKGSAGGEGIGPILGDEINAQFGMDDGVLLSFTSRNAQLGTTGQLPCESELPQLVSVSPAVGSLLSVPSADSMELVGSEGKLPRYRWHLGCILLKMPAISLLTGGRLSPGCGSTARSA